MAIAALIVSIGSAFGAAAAALYAARQAHQAKVANAFPAVIDMFSEYRSPALSRARSRVFDLLDEQPTNPVPLSELPDEARENALAVCHYLDNLGVLVAEQLMDAAVAARYLGDTCLALWKRLRPYIEAEREKRARRGFAGPRDYLRYFEHLGAAFEELEPARQRANLKRWNPTPSGEHAHADEL
jgi:hypothetical protein